MPRKLSFLLSLLLVMALVVVGCSQQPAATDTGSAPSKSAAETEASDNTPVAQESLVTAPGTFPVVNKKMSFTFFAPQSTVIEDITTNDFTVMYEEKSNVHIDWELVPQADLNDQKKLSFASGDYPDAYFACGISHDEEMEYGGKLFIPLNDLIDKYSLDFKKVIDSLKYIKPMITTPDGSIYCLPTTTYEESHLICPDRYWINTYWLNALQLNAPTTTDEFYEVMKAFKNDDPNGNGAQDEVPLILGAPSLTTYGCAAYFMCAFIYDDGGNRFRILDGDIVDPVFNKPEWKEGLL